MFLLSEIRMAQKNIFIQLECTYFSCLIKFLFSSLFVSDVKISHIVHHCGVYETKSWIVFKCQNVVCEVDTPNEEEVIKIN